MKFQPHGRASCRREGNLLVLELEGPWNAELMQQTRQDVRSLKASLPEKAKWGLLVVFSHSLLCSFDSIDVIRNNVQEDARHQGHAAVGFVAARSVEGRGLVDDIFRRIYDGICPMAFFESIDDGKAWVGKYLDDSSG